MMDDQTYDRYKKAFEAIKYSDDSRDKEAQEKMKARLIAEYGADDDDVDTLLKYHT